jgi:5-methylcytosine-specific restriction enzyme B
MSLSERRAEFEAAARADPLVTPATKFHKLFGVSNSAKVIGGGLQLGVVNLDNVAPSVDGFAFAGTMVFPPADEVYFATYVRSGAAAMVARLAEMKQLGAGSAPSKTATPDSEDEPTERPGFAARNNNVVVVLADDGNLYLRNQGFWDALPVDRGGLGPAIPVDRINVALYPPAASAQRSMLAREFVGYLGRFVGREKVHELRPWADAAAPAPEMRRAPSEIPVAELEAAVGELGGYYPHGELARYHAGLNFLAHKHFVILAGLSGTGKTQLALKYARAVHGVKAATATDPFLFVCPVRPEWTDPSGLTGYYDVLSNRYQVPPFLEAVLLATAHRDSPVFVVLDEMNLARVEYYLSDVLSAVETGEPLQLHASGVNLEGSTGESVPATLPMPPNLYITGTINIDETTNPVSDKVLDRAVVIDMSTVDLAGFLKALEARVPDLNAACAETAPQLLVVQALMAQHGLGFGYRVAEEAVRYQAFAAGHLKADSAAVTDDLLVQKVLVKLRGGERQRPLLTGLAKALPGLPRSLAMIARLTEDLDEYGSFQASR